MNRRDFVAKTNAALLIAMSVPSYALALDTNPFQPRALSWRTFKVATSAIVAADTPPIKAWIPIPAFDEADWMRPGTTIWDSNADSVEIVHVGPWATRMLYAQWQRPRPDAHITATSLVSARDRYVSLSQPSQPPGLTAEERRIYTSATELLPTDGIVATTAQHIVGAVSNDTEKAKLLYEWVVVNASRNPKTRGCGLGNVSFMLETGDISGKCADINGLYVALSRASGLPARDLYGIRVAPSRFGYKSLGANSSVITKAQHCRAEVYLSEYGWVPVDPADVRKVMLEEPPGHLGIDDPKVSNARQTLFGAWEGNYIVFNDGHDVALPGSSGPDVGFLMYPQAEIQGQRRDSLAPDDFVYSITSEEIAN